MGLLRDILVDGVFPNRELWFWLNDAIELSFQDPNLVRTALSDGRLMENCVQSVRGY